jgi:sulfur carrier protein ThiS adenylyltransferase
VNGPALSLADRDIRQRDLVPPLKLASCRAVVIGVGAIGRQVALQLATVGIGKMDLIDFDRAGVENLAPQGYFESDVGKLKVEATAATCQMINPAVQVTQHPERFRRSSPKTLAVFTDPASQPVVFCCVDSIATRQLIWEAVCPVAAFFVDGRMSAEAIRVLAVGRPALDVYYATTLFASEQAYAGSCTAKSTVYTASIAAGLMLGQFTRWLRQMPVERDLHLNLLSCELSVA